MPLPLGHAAVGITVGELVPGKKKPVMDWKYYLVVTLLANLPDIDIIFGLLSHGNGSLFHRGMTHSLLFALFTGAIAAQSLKISPKLPKITFWTCFLVIFSHIIADLLFTSSPVSLFWPFELYYSPGHKGWWDILNIVLFKGYRDAVIIIGSAIIFFLARKIFTYRYSAESHF
jgi:inner membrane protein